MAARQKAFKRSLEEQLDDAVRQWDQVQSILASASYRIVELAEAVNSLQRQLDELQPQPTKSGAAGSGILYRYGVPIHSYRYN